MPSKKSLISIIAALKVEEKKLSTQYASVQKRLQQTDSDLKRVQSALAILQNKSLKNQISSKNGDQQDTSSSADASSVIIDGELMEVIDALLSDLSEVKAELSQYVRKAAQDLTRFEEPSERAWALRTF